MVVLPVYNEADSITAVLGEVREAAERLQLTGVRTSVVLVDDESPDGTGDVARAVADRIGLDLTLVRGKRNGLGAAMLRGLAEALTHDPDAIVALDGDGQHNPTDIPTLHRAFTARRADIVIGSRWTRGGRAPGTSTGRALGSRIGNRVFRAVSGTRGVKDATTSFRVYSPRVVRFLLSTKSNRYSGFSFFSTTIGLAEAAGYVITEVPIEFRPRYGGQSKLNGREVWKYFASLPSIRAERRRCEGMAYAADERPPAELEALRSAKRWNGYVVDQALTGVTDGGIERIVGVGAGVSGVTDVLLARFPAASAVFLERAEADQKHLAEQYRGDERVQVLAGTLADGQAHVGPGSTDLVVYVNLLEHIDGDGPELHAAAQVLRRGGVLSVFVPAMEWLYGPQDAKSGRKRRYSIDHLRQMVEATGLEVVHVGYVDRLGVAPYWFNYRLLNKSSIGSGSMRTFDRVFVPVTTTVERALSWMPAGRGLVCIARRV